MDESDKVFYGNMCFICHLTIKEKELKKCGSCKLVFYCSEAHQKIHWKFHNHLCRVIRKIDSALQTENLESHLDWYSYRMKFLMLCELKMERKLLPCEVNMILFPNNCQICHRKSNLQACLDCLCVNYCSEDHKQADLPSHKNVCHLFALCVELDLFLEKTLYYPHYSFRKKELNLKDTMNNFIENNILLERKSSITLTQEKALVSEFITCPLSLLHAARLINYEFRGNVELHIVGSSFLETASLKCWEIILHANSQIEKLIIHFIGPEVKEEIDMNLCESCQNKLTLSFSKGFYHDQLNSTLFREPNLICTFNCGYHEYENSDSDTWKKTLPYLIRNKKVPLIFTSFTEGEAMKDADRLLKLNKNLRLKICKNPFSSLRPYRDFENLGVYFNNEYMGIVSNDL